MPMALELMLVAWRLLPELHLELPPRSILRDPQLLLWVEPEPPPKEWATAWCPVPSHSSCYGRRGEVGAAADDQAGQGAPSAGQRWGEVLA